MRPNGSPWEGVDRGRKGPEMEPWVSLTSSLSRGGGACRGACRGVASELGRTYIGVLPWLFVNTGSREGSTFERRAWSSLLKGQVLLTG